MGTPIKTYICQTKCFHNNRLWTPGESLQVSDGKEPPKHFVPKHAYKAPVLNEAPKDPRAHAEWLREQNQEALRAVGHGPKAAPAIAGLPAAPAPSAPSQTGTEAAPAATDKPVNAEGQAAADAGNVESAFS